MANKANSLSVRIPDDMVERTDRLVERLADSPEALAAGGKWGRSAIVRLALRAGLEALDGQANRSRSTWSEDQRDEWRSMQEDIAAGLREDMEAESR